MDQLMDYFRELVQELKYTSDKKKEHDDTKDGAFLKSQYEKLKFIPYQSVLACYTHPNRRPQKRTPPRTLIYPFGINLSQKTAVENAFKSQVSIIQGPPGTGKTQTILNIIFNAILNNKTVAVVSNNNYAIDSISKKLDKCGLSFFCAFLGNADNKNAFFANQPEYPSMDTWALSYPEYQALKAEIGQFVDEVSEIFKSKNRLAEIEQEFLALLPEEEHFQDYYREHKLDEQIILKNYSSQKIIALWVAYENQLNQYGALGLLKKLLLLLRFDRYILKLFRYSPELIIPYLQNQFYVVKKYELNREQKQLEQFLTQHNFDKKLESLTQKSMKLFKATLFQKYGEKESREKFKQKEDLYQKSQEFVSEYPVILSTTHSIRNNLSYSYLYDYVIVDEASQVDLTTGVLAMACAKNMVIVGDMKQLPFVLSGENEKIGNQVWKKYALDDVYCYTKHSLLSSATELWKDCPSVLLREHYRCHPKIINFCNQKFYNNELILMTKDYHEENVLSMRRTVSGNHARGHENTRELEVIVDEVLPKLKATGAQDIGIIAPYRDQVALVKNKLGETYEVETVHKFQGREKNTIILTTVDNEISEFNNDTHMLNVAVSRAIQSLVVVTSNHPNNDKTHYGDLARYIQYHNCDILESKIRSVFDLLYKQYNKERKAYLAGHKPVSYYDSENIIAVLLQNIFSKPMFPNLKYQAHVPLNHFIRDYTGFTKEEAAYARKLSTHVDFLIFNDIDKQPLLAIEVDGTRFHKPGSVQAQRDKLKNQIFEKCAIPLIRLRTDGSREEERIENALLKILQ